MTGIEKAGEYGLSMRQFFLPGPLEPGDEARVLDLYRRPLEIAVRPLVPAGGPPALTQR